MPSGFKARAVSLTTASRSATWLEHVAAVSQVELAVCHGQPLPGSDPIVDIESGGGGVATCRLDRHLGWIHPDHPASETRELFGQEAAPAADVKGAQIPR
jgi:hypothetical protein